MTKCGEYYEKGVMFVPELLAAGMAARAAISELESASEIDKLVKEKGVVLIGTIEGDIHDIGKDLVKMLLVGNGFKVIDLGVDVPAERFVKAIKNYNPDIVGISALLTTTMINIPKVIDAFKKAKLRKKVGVLIGGAAVTKEYAIKIGADGYASNAFEATEWAKKFIK